MSHNILCHDLQCLVQKKSNKLALYAAFPESQEHYIIRIVGCFNQLNHQMGYVIGIFIASSFVTAFAVW